jgi:predicted nucleotidyltransferase component of viral defense system
MPRELRNIGASVRARLLDRARAERSDFQILLTRYALERLLYRLSVSPHRDRFILKGAMLFVTWVADPYRPTRDLDLLGSGDNAAEAIAETFRAICAQPVADDGVIFDVVTLEAAPIREEVEYGGVRVRTTATIAGARIPIQVDIGFGDAITPAPVEIDYPALLDAPAPHLRAYPVDTVVAEKFEALVTLGMANSRLKDFYDLWLIAQTFKFGRSTLSDAVQRTFERRGTALPADIPVGLTDEFAAARAAQWRAFLTRERMAAAPDGFTTVIGDLQGFLMPLLVGSNADLVWPTGGPWSLGAPGDE